MSSFHDECCLTTDQTPGMPDSDSERRQAWPGQQSGRHTALLWTRLDSPHSPSVCDYKLQSHTLY